MTDRELMQMALDALELVTDLTSHDEEVYEAIDALRAALAQPEPKKVQLHEFLKAVEGKENFIGIPFVWAEWPTREEQ